MVQVEGVHPSGVIAHDDADIPASVTCALCGAPDAECLGCVAGQGSGLAKSTPWEERHLPRWQRLLRTARLVTLEGETFFGELRDGSVGSAFGFAMACEFLAIGSLVAIWLPIVYAFVPGYVEALLADPESRRMALVISVGVVPALSLFMVLLHVLWAVSLEIGLRACGAPPRPAHSIRYALYSCGWDFVTSPFGFGAGCVDRGFRTASGELHAAVRIPRFATAAYVERARQIPMKEARRALWIAVALTGSMVLTGAFALGAAIVRALV